jgi:hypothetical protein
VQRHGLDPVPAVYRTRTEASKPQISGSREDGRVKRRELLRAVARAAREAGLEWELLRQGADHEIWSLDGHRVTVPRHREINELTARGILRALEAQLGEDWWRR